MAAARGSIAEDRAAQTLPDLPQCASGRSAIHSIAVPLDPSRRTHHAGEVHPRKSIPPELRRLAAEQADVLTREQALGLGLTRSVLHRLLTQEIWTPLASGLYHTNGTRASWQSLAWGGVLVGGDQAMLFDAPQWSPELEETLREWLRSPSGPGEVARRLGIHRNTLSYRLEKIGELGSFDPKDPSDIFTLTMSLLLRDLHIEQHLQKE